MFSESKFYALYNGELHFRIRELVAELHAFEYGGTTYSTFEKTYSKFWRIMLKLSLATVNPSKFSALICALFQF